MLFKKIFNFTEKQVEAEAKDRREDTRYPLGEGFPLKVSVTLVGHDDTGAILPGSWRDWGAHAVNLSRKGCNLRVSDAASGKRSEPCRVTFNLGKHAMNAVAHIAHFRVHDGFAALGAAYEFEDFASQKAYLQLLAPVITGVSLAKVPASEVNQQHANLRLEQYAGEENTLLSIWRKESNPSEFEGFEFRMSGYHVRAHALAKVVDVYSPDGTKPTPTEAAEITQLYKWVIPNLSKAVAADVKTFLAKFAK